LQRLDLGDRLLTQCIFKQDRQYFTVTGLNSLLVDSDCLGVVVQYLLNRIILLNALCNRQELGLSCATGLHFVDES
jgi:hypothetical protein